MFEAIARTEKTPSRLRSALVVGSVAAHAAVAAALMMTAMWKIDMLAIDRQPTLATAPATLPEPPEPEPEPPPRDKIAKAESPANGPARPAVVERTQLPSDPANVIVDEDVVVATGPVGDGPKGPGVGGFGTGFGGDCEGPSCLPPVDAPPPPPKPPEPPPPAFVAEQVLEGYRIAGEDQIHPPERVRASMIRDGKTNLLAVVGLCVSTAGTPTKIKVERSSGYADYDARFVSAMKAWRYKPYRAGGVAVPVCTKITFRYIMK